MEAERLRFVEIDRDTYTAHMDGRGVVYFVMRSAQWHYRWQAFTARTTGATPHADKPLGDRHRTRNDAFVWLCRTHPERFPTAPGTL